MIDHTSQFFAILTNVGTAKQANADALGIAWKITQMGVGDANRTDPIPDAGQRALINEWRRAPLNALKVDPVNPSIIIAEQVIPADVGGRWIREIGLYDADGDLVAVANCAPSFKPLLSQGSGKTQVVRMNMVVSSAANVELKIDPSVVLATKEFVTEELAKQDFKHSAWVATTANINLAGLQTIDGAAVPAGKRVLVRAQTEARNNGLYLTAVGAWTRTSDANTHDKVTPGMLVLIEQGVLYGDSGWQLLTDGAITLGVTALAFGMAFGRTGIAPGSYRSVTVDQYGRVVSATNPTTVAQYGLTDVYTKSQVFSKGETYARADVFTKDETSRKVADAVAALVSSSPEALDTLSELAAALGNDPNFAASVNNQLASKAPKHSPTLTGIPKAPRPGPADDSEQIPCTAWVWASVRSSVHAAEANKAGMCVHFAMASPPAGYLRRNGAAVSRTTYAALFARIGTIYGAGDGSTTFNLPDSRGSFDRGWDEQRGLDSNRVFGSTQTDQNARHTHSGTTASAGAHAHTLGVNLDRSPAGDGNAVFGDEDYYGKGALSTASAGAHTHAVTIGASGGTEARPHNVAFLPCIRY